MVLYGQLWGSRPLNETLCLCVCVCVHVCENRAPLKHFSRKHPFICCHSYSLTSRSLTLWVFSSLRVRRTCPSSLGSEEWASSGEGEGEWEEKLGEKPLHSSIPASLEGGVIHVQCNSQSIRSFFSQLSCMVTSILYMYHCCELVISPAASCSSRVN